MGYKNNGRPSRLILALACAWVLSACTGSADKVDALSVDMSLTGSVGDGPIINADIVVTDANGQLVTETTSDLSATYELVIPDGTPLPVIATATGGTDLVTGQSAEFPLRAIAFESGPVTLNMTPYTTLALQVASCGDKRNPKGIADAWQTINDNLNLGWRTELVPDPMADRIDNANVATVLLSSEALGEVFRRAEAALNSAGSSVSIDELVEGLACDLADGQLDGSGQSVQQSTTLLAAIVSVQVELLAGELHVDGQPVASLLDSALRTVVPESDASVLDVMPPQALIDQTLVSLGVLQGVFPDRELTTLQVALQEAGENTARGLVAEILDAGARNNLQGLATRVALQDEQLLAEVNDRLQGARQANPPILSLSADDELLADGATTGLSWASTGADQCIASGAWSGMRATEGVFQTDPLTELTNYELACSGLGGSVVASVTVAMVSSEPPPAPEPAPEPEPEPAPAPEPEPPAPEPEPAPEPTLSFSVEASVVDSGAATMLNWTAENADSCSASGGWTGSKPTTGSESTGNLTASVSFSLNCTGPGGNAMAMLQVDVNGTMSLNWVAPTENVDGTPLTDLSGYRIYYGTDSRDYSQVRDAVGATTTSQDITAVSGTYYVAMTALDGDGNESGYSNEVLKTVP